MGAAKSFLLSKPRPEAGIKAVDAPECKEPPMLTSFPSVPFLPDSLNQARRTSRAKRRHRNHRNRRKARMGRRQRRPKLRACQLCLGPKSRSSSRSRCLSWHQLPGHQLPQDTGPRLNHLAVVSHPFAFFSKFQPSPSPDTANTTLHMLLYVLRLASVCCLLFVYRS